MRENTDVFEMNVPEEVMYEEAIIDVHLAFLEAVNGLTVRASHHIAWLGVHLPVGFYKKVRVEHIAIKSVKNIVLVPY